VTHTTRTTTVESVAEREISRRQESVYRAKEAMAHGRQALREKDYQVAVAQYKVACDLLPESDATHSLRKEALEGLCEASVKLAEQRIAEGRFADAETSAKLVLDERYDPHCKAALVLLSHMEDPEYYNRTITPKFRASVEEVKKLFTEAQGFYDTGRYDLAFKRYEQILNLDPYNIAARKGQERVNLARDNYAVSGYNEARSRSIWRVDDAWQNPVRKYGSIGTALFESHAQDTSGTARITTKLNQIIIPKIEFREATVREAIDFLKQKSRELDPETDPAKPKGVNIVLKLESTSGSVLPTPTGPTTTEPAIPGLETAPATVPAAPTAALISPSEARITLSLTNIPLMEALRYITNLANLKIKVEPFAISIVPLSEPTEVLVTKEYRVPPGFISNSASKAEVSGALSGGASKTGSRDATGAGSNIAGRASARDFLEGQGVSFPPGASANFLPSSSRLVVRNTQQNLDLIDTLVDAAVGTAPSQVEIQAKFVEITQQNLKELSFDWQLGQFNIPGTDKVFGGGGTTGGVIQTPGDFPFLNPSGNPVGGFPLTAGNRTGSLGISANAIDALLFPVPASRAAAGIFGLAGVFTDPQFQVVMRALNQKKGIDLLSAPRVTTKSGQRAVIEIIREFRYPTEFDPPQIPQNVGGGGNNNTNPITGISTASTTSIPVTPTTPTSFETRNTGVTLEVEPVVGPDGATIDLQLQPQVVEFEGFINYGSPILAPPTVTTIAGIPVPGASQQDRVLTANVINQPIFSTRKVSTSVSIWDGQTVILGGLMREDVQKVEDKVPLLGDLPLFGRLFRSSIDQHLKRNLVIFVTARLINPAGEPLNFEEEKEEIVEPIGLPEIAPPPLPEAPYFKK
jgi:general secretion pathway protein D